MTAWIAWRILKFVGFGLHVAGVYGALTGETAEARRRALHGPGTWGMVATWIAGYALMKSTGVSMGEPWISAALLTSLSGLVALMGWVHHGARGLAGALAAGGLLATIVLMTTRAAAAVPLALGLGYAAGGLVASFLSRPEHALDEAALRRWFRTVAHAEGLTVIVLMGVAMPLRMVWDVHLDGGTGLIGWTHGVMVLVYLPALVSTGWVFGWSWGRLLAGFLASFVPLGTFWFVRRVEG
jgi:integral membrane protein